eukprot:scpid20457/ scgid30282/ 
MPRRWTDNFSKPYNDWQAKKEKRPRIDASTLEAHGRALLALLPKVCLSGSQWLDIRQDIDGFATTLQGYCKYLASAGVQQQWRQQQPHPVRQVSTNITVQRCEHAAQENMGNLECALSNKMAGCEDYVPQLFDEQELFGCTLTFLKDLKSNLTLDIMRYDPGGGRGCVVFLWKCPQSVEVTSDAYATKVARILSSLEEKLPTYHTRQMRKSFFSSYSSLSGLTPVVLRSVYQELTGDVAVSTNPAMDRRMQLYILGELPEIDVDLRRLNSGRPAVFDRFFEKAAEVLSDCQAEDSRRHGVAHLSKFLSIRDLHEQVRVQCPDVEVPSLEWLRLQFLPVDPRTSAAIRYTGKLHVKKRVQSRILRASHEDDHYAAAVFKYMRAMAVDLKEHDPLFLCMDDKAKVPVGEPDRPTSTNVRSKATYVEENEQLTAMDHDLTKCSLTPSVILRCDIPDMAEGSFYRGQVDVRVKDSVFEPSNPFRHMAELRASACFDGAVCPPIAFVYTDGGVDHRVTCRSVQLAYIALFIKEDLDLLVAGRTCPGHSFANPAERVMATLNLGLQNAAFARVRMTDESESRIKSANSMAAVRTAAEQYPDVKQDWKQSIEPVKEHVEQRFRRLVYSGTQVRAPDLVADEDVRAIITHLWPDVDLAKLTAKDLSGKLGLQKFLDSHCRIRQYTFQVSVFVLHALNGACYGVCHNLY